MKIGPTVFGGPHGVSDGVAILGIIGPVSEMYSFFAFNLLIRRLTKPWNVMEWLKFI